MTNDEKARLIRMKRKALDYTVQGAAEKMKLTETAYNQIEIGNRHVDKLSVHTFLAVCYVLQLDPLIFYDI